MSRSATRVTFSDKSTAVTKSVTGKGDVAGYGSVTAAPVHEPLNTGVLLGVPKFTTLTFTNVQVNGTNIGTYTAATGLYEFIRTTNGSAPPSGTVRFSRVAWAQHRSHLSGSTTRTNTPCGCLVTTCPVCGPRTRFCMGGCSRMVPMTPTIG